MPNAVRDLSKIDDFQKINFRKSVIEKEQIKADYDKLKSSKGSEQHNQLVEKEKELDRIIIEKGKNLRKLDEDVGIVKNKITTSAVQLYESFKIAGAVDQIELSYSFNFTSEDVFDNLPHHVNLWTAFEINKEIISSENKTLIETLLANYKIQLNSIVQIEKTLNEKINKELDAINRQLLTLSSKITGGMQKYKSEFPTEAADVDAKIEFKDDFKKIHKKIVEDDLPKFEERFRKLLKEGTINELLIFKNNLERYEKEIKRKIEEINNHLEGIDYNQGTFIKIIEDKIVTDDIKQFKIDLKNSTEGVFGDSELYSEEKFIQVKKILDRFSSVKEEDKKWVDKVTDVRHWYAFGASERNREDQTEREYYSDSSGKSGGQKEKLAYTILASAIAYQFGLSWGEPRSRSFRFVVIDEAFGRGSDESTRYGLRLFEKLNLQLLIVTPLQKINIIEDYINAVHFVSNPSGYKSLVRRGFIRFTIISRRTILRTRTGTKTPIKTL